MHSQKHDLLRNTFSLLNRAFTRLIRHMWAREKKYHCASLYKKKPFPEMMIYYHMRQMLKNISTIPINSIEINLFLFSDPRPTMLCTVMH